MDWSLVTSIVVPSAVVSAFITAVINYYFERRRDVENRLFDTKRSVYANVMSTIHYPFLKDGMTEEEYKEIVRAVSAARILASKELREHLDDVFDLADELEHEEDPAKRQALLDTNVSLRHKIEHEMRKELGIA